MNKTSSIRIVVICFLIFFISCNNNRKPPGTKASLNNVFTAVKYDKVVAYDYNGGSGVEIIDQEGKLAGNIKKQVELTKEQVTRLTNALCDSTTYGGDRAACFEPHFGIVFYQADKPVAHISICLDCNYLISSIKIPVASGFSYDGYKRIIEFEKELNFDTAEKVSAPAGRDSVSSVLDKPPGYTDAGFGVSSRR